MQLGEFFIALGFDVDDQKLKNFNENIKDLGKDFLKISAVAAGTVYSINAFVSGSIQAATALRNFNAETGNSIENLQKWQVVSVLTNAAMSAERATSSFRAMAKSLADIEMGKGSAGQLSMLGIPDARGMDVGEVLEILRQNYPRNKDTWARSGNLMTVHGIMEEFGFDLGMLPALQLPTSVFEEKARGKYLDEASIEKLVKLGDAISKFNLDFKLFKDQLSADWSPALIQGLEAATPILKDFVNSFLAVADAIGELSNEDKAALASMATALFILFFPVTSMFVALAAAIWDVGRALRGLESYTGNGLKWLNEKVKINEGSYLDLLLQDINFMMTESLKSLPEIEVNEGNIRNPSPSVPYSPIDFQQRSDLMRYYSGSLNPAVSSDRRVERMIQETQNTMNNVYNIDGATDPMTLSEMIMLKQKQMLDSTLAEKNNGVRY